MYGYVGFSPTGGTVATAFTAAFVHAKVDEITAQLEMCLSCTCTPTGPECVPLPASQCGDGEGMDLHVYV